MNLYESLRATFIALDEQPHCDQLLAAFAGDWRAAALLAREARRWWRAFGSTDTRRQDEEEEA